jgi:preprotein translocase subunit YajC
MAGNPNGQGSSNPIGMFLPIILIFGIMYFLIFRPQMKRQKEQRKMLENIKKGDKIVTVGGIIGEVAGIKEKENVLIVKIADNTKIDLIKSSVAKVIGPEAGS